MRYAELPYITLQHHICFDSYKLCHYYVRVRVQLYDPATVHAVRNRPRCISKLCDHPFSLSILCRYFRDITKTEFCPPTSDYQE
jgi:hypothetical protein